MVPHFDRLAPFLKIDLMVVHQEVGGRNALRETLGQTDRTVHVFPTLWLGRPTMIQSKLLDPALNTEPAMLVSKTISRTRRRPKMSPRRPPTAAAAAWTSTKPEISHPTLAGSAYKRVTVGSAP